MKPIFNPDRISQSQSRFLSHAAKLVLILLCGTAFAEEAVIDLGSEALPGVIVSAQQTGRWVAGTMVQVHVTVTDDADGAPTTTAITLRSGAPGLAQEAWGPAITGKAGTVIAYPVDADTVAHTTVYVTLDDAGGNRLTSQFALIR